VVALAALPAFGDHGGVALASARPPRSAAPAEEATPAPTREPTPKPTPKPTATPKPTPEPTAVPTPEPTPVDPGEVADLCDPIFELPCGLGPGRYSPSRFEPSISVKVDAGWSAATNGDRLVVLARDEGFMTFASAIDLRGASAGQEDSARKLIDAIVARKGLDVTRPAKVRIEKLQGRSVDVTPTGSDRIELFTAGGSTYFVEPGRVTRVVALDVDREVLVIVIEPGDGRTLEAILETADGVAASLRRR
jgi:hypothetical protein